MDPGDSGRCRLHGAALGVLLLAAPVLAAGPDDLQRRIEERLARQGLDRRADITVSVEAGVPRLSGIVTRLADLRQAERAARKEARAVVNLIRVVPEQPRSDRSLLEAVKGEVRQWARYGALDAIDVEVVDGVARLRGWVDLPGKREEIEDRLAQIDGIRDVHDDLHVQGFSAWDVRLRSEILERIYASPLFEPWVARLSDPPVRVYVARGRVTLAGTVGSAVEQAAVGQIARETLAFSVNNQVRVRTGASERETPKTSGVDPES
jgi:osmotically-inducible protein OsmY